MQGNIGGFLCYNGYKMIFLKIMAGAIFNLLGILVLIKGIGVCRTKGIREGFIELIAGFAFVLIGLLIWTGYIS
jgi:hypothetical protein